MPVPGTPAWVEVSAEDPAASREFYGRLLGWSFEVSLDPLNHGYAVARHGGERVAGLYEASEGVPPGWLLYLHAPDVDAVRDRVPALGGQVVAGPVDLPGAGRALLATDPSGAAVGFWQPTAERSLATGRTGALSRVELLTGDTAAATRFYGGVFGQERQANAERQPGQERQPGARGPAPAADQGQHRAGEPARLAIAAAPARRRSAGRRPSRWVVHFAVDPAAGVDAATELAIALGGAVEVPPFDSPHGRTAILRDPCGARFSLVDPHQRVLEVGRSA
ncbi:VOC family protein [Saccharothrix xinjiangensis]|uniref:VOC family protein n=1 Tax=Saccharothrix xinjiangensis TaxID=204798 RepID=A0ABV9XTB7_9PSEU